MSAPPIRTVSYSAHDLSVKGHEEPVNGPRQRYAHHSWSVKASSSSLRVQVSTSVRRFVRHAYREVGLWRAVARDSPL